MSKTRTHNRRHHKRRGRGLFKGLTRTTGRVASGLKKVGVNVKNITMKSRPKVEKGLGLLYKSVLTGIDLGVKGIKKSVHTITRKTRRHR
jgi:hypothetical protein